MKVTVVGAGNMGLALTAYMTVHRKADVTLFTRKGIRELWMYDREKKTKARADGFWITDDPRNAFTEADLILVTYPAFLRKKFISENQSYFRKGVFLGFVPGYGGAEYSCAELIDRGVIIFGFQRVPYVARATQDTEQKMAEILSSKNRLYIGAIPKEKTYESAEIIEHLLDIPTDSLKEYLSITLAPSNPLLHITGLYNVFRDYEKGRMFDRPLHFYEEWNDFASEILFKYDDELQQICRRLAPLDMSEVIPLPIYYESATPHAMTEKLKSIESFKVVTVPLKMIDGGYIPDLSSRMFVEDYPFGVCIIKDFALKTGVVTPIVDMLLKFYEKMSGHRYFNSDGTYTKEIQDTGIPGIYGLGTKEDIIAFYHR